MPPKKAPATAGGKGKEKEVQDKKKLKEATKVAEDKTFGMKNKNKSKTVQKYLTLLLIFIHILESSKVWELYKSVVGTV